MTYEGLRCKDDLETATMTSKKISNTCTADGLNISTKTEYFKVNLNVHTKVKIKYLKCLNLIIFVNNSFSPLTENTYRFPREEKIVNEFCSIFTYILG